MRFLKLVLAALILPVFPSISAAGRADQLRPPMATVKPHTSTLHGDTRVDDYYWLHDRNDPEVVKYLEAENAYTDAMMAHAKSLEDLLFEEIKGRVKQADESVPYELEGYFYYYRYEEGKSYRIYCRKKASMEAPEQVILDVNRLAEGHDHMRVRGLEVSPDGNILAYATDSVGRRIYTIHFKDLRTGEHYDDTVEQATGGTAWANDNRTVFYATQDAQTLRSNRIFRHVLGTDSSRDELVYEEEDNEFSCYVWKTKSNRYLAIGSYQSLSSEIRYLDADEPAGNFVVFLPREENHEYDIDHYKDRFYIRTNDQAENFRLMSTPVGSTDKEHWVDVIAHRDDVLLEGFEVFQDYLVVEERKNGLIQLRVRPWSGDGEHYLEFDEPAYLAYTSSNYEFASPRLRFVYTSMTTPPSTYDYHMATREKVLLKQDEVLGGFDSSEYETDRLYASAADGTKVPISIVYRKGVRKDGQNPLLLYGYGSYGYSTDASFRASRLSLLDRGFVFAIAHVRGGQEMGRRWYDDGKLLRKKNTFTDFIACAEFLVREGYTSPERLYAMGGSAGGLLMGAVVNMRPDLFDGVIAHVPFVDVVTTMLDESIPLTTGEYDEWGDPHEKRYYDYMLSYSPYDNVRPMDYPHLLITTGLHDSQVQYWEPAKWAARLRASKTDGNRLLLKTYMDAGHSGGSGRFRSYRETAFDFAFLLDLAGWKEPTKLTP